jgi:hypothetical protein
MRAFFLVVLIAACSAVPGAHDAPPAVNRVQPTELDSALRDELLAMRNEDQRVRRAWIASPEDESIKAEASALAQRNQARVIEIIERYGWPGNSLVGAKASGAAWTLLQHSSLDVLKRYLPVMEAAVAAGELDHGLLATTIDRVRVNEGQPQVYGTQFRQENGEWVPYPIERRESKALLSTHWRSSAGTDRVVTRRAGAKRTSGQA